MGGDSFNLRQGMNNDSVVMAAVGVNSNTSKLIHSASYLPDTVPNILCCLILTITVSQATHFKVVKKWA